MSLNAVLAEVEAIQELVAILPGRDRRTEDEILAVMLAWKGPGGEVALDARVERLDIEVGDIRSRSR